MYNLRNEILKKCPDEFEVELDNFINKIENELNDALLDDDKDALDRLRKLADSLF